MYIHVIHYTIYTVYTHTASIQDRITIHWLQKTLHIHTCMYKCIYIHTRIYTYMYIQCMPATVYTCTYAISASPYSVRFQYKAIHKDGAVLGHLVTTRALKLASRVRMQTHPFPRKETAPSCKTRVRRFLRRAPYIQSMIVYT